MESESNNIEDDDVETVEVDSHYAIKSAIELLIEMSSIAMKTSNGKLMSSAAAGWLEVHDRLEVEEEEEALSSIGFTGGNNGCK